MTPRSNQFGSQPLNDHDVLAFGDATWKVSKFKQAVEQVFAGPLGSQFSSQLNSRGIQIDPRVVAPSGRAEEHSRWFDQGVDCEVLQPGAQAWKKAKIRIKFAIEIGVEADPPQPQGEVPTPATPISENNSREKLIDLEQFTSVPWHQHPPQ